MGNDVQSLRAELDRVKSCLSCWVSLLPDVSMCAEIAEGLSLGNLGWCKSSSPWSLGLGVGQSLCWWTSESLGARYQLGCLLLGVIFLRLWALRSH